MPFWPFGKKTDAQAYERELADLASKISLRQQKVYNYNIRCRRVKGLFTLYSVFLYTIYSAIILFHKPSQTRGRLIGFFLIPVAIYLVRRVVTAFFNWLISSNEEHLKKLKAEQSDKIEELKRKTNFYSTQALINRFDVNSKPRVVHPPQRQGPNSPPPQRQGSNRGSPSLGSAGTSGSGQFTPPVGLSGEFKPELPNLKPDALSSPSSNDVSRNSPGTSVATGSTLASPAMIPQAGLEVVHSVPYQPQWYDKIIDLIAGEDEYSPKNRYALICENCRNHNGLAQPGELPQHVVYICPRCGVQNGKPKKRKESVAPEGHERKRSVATDSLEKSPKEEEESIDISSNPAGTTSIDRLQFDSADSDDEEDSAIRRRKKLDTKPSKRHFNSDSDH
ncbi:hypothetical protein TRVA0_002S03532 [Trichomonascus vanleenenianus]|uniref:uncharacterized protein n=1 Tax=Trichomonascus vanleenenianus TaxID=2268995 RepID=UPI003EC99388